MKHEAADAGISHAAAGLREAQPSWETCGVEERVRHLGRLRDWLLDNERVLTDMLVDESGKARQDAALEVLSGIDVINYFSARAPEALAEERRRPHGPLSLTKELWLSHRPYPLVGVISPWNFPIILALMDAVPALLAGSAVLLKPSELTPRTIGRIAEAWQRELGAPPVLEVVEGAGDVGAAVVDAVDYVQFTGSPQTGRTVAGRAAERLIPCGLELGGKDPMIVLADAPLERAVNAAAWGGLFNSGQTCVSVERVYVEEPIYDTFVERLVERVREIAAKDLGAMASQEQLELVAAHVRDAKRRGARVPVGGRRAGGLRYEPTVLADVDESMRIAREETFGPVIPVMPVSGEDEAVERANDSPYGLSASVWCADHKRGRRVAARLEAGAVNVNDVYANLFALPLPMGGWKESGIGARLGGDDAIRKYCRSQAVTVARLTPASELAWYPYTALRWAVVHGVVRLAGARDWRRRLGLR
jgi:acyl-CoA reductase-like NAD-dependent aldehyde dehydrogenase